MKLELGVNENKHSMAETGLAALERPAAESGRPLIHMSGRCCRHGAALRSASTELLEEAQKVAVRVLHDQFPNALYSVPRLSRYELRDDFETLRLLPPFDNVDSGFTL